MKLRLALRLLSIAALVALSFKLRERIWGMPVPLADKDAYRGQTSIPPGERWFPESVQSAAGRPGIEVFAPELVGDSVERLIQWLGPPDVRQSFHTPVVDAGATQGIQRSVIRQFPDYQGTVESIMWKKEWQSVVRWYQAFYVTRDGRMVLIELISWKDGVQI